MAHALSVASDFVTRTDYEKTKPSPEAVAAAMLSEQFSPLFATATTRAGSWLRLRSVSTGAMVAQPAVLPEMLR